MYDRHAHFDSSFRGWFNAVEAKDTFFASSQILLL